MTLISKYFTVDVKGDRFFSKVLSDAGPGCYEWTGCRNACGYGSFRPESGKQSMLAHRYAWEMFNGPIPAGMCVCHRCDNPACVRIDHLFLGTHAENMRDRDTKGRCGAGKANLAKTHCPRGHGYTPDNLAAGQGPRRVCKACRAADARDPWWSRRTGVGAAMRQRRPFRPGGLLKRKTLSKAPVTALPSSPA